MTEKVLIAPTYTLALIHGEKLGIDKLNTIADNSIRLRGLSTSVIIYVVDHNTLSATTKHMLKQVAILGNEIRYISSRFGGTTMIPVNGCKDRYVYEVKARNFSLAVFNSKERRFVGIREKAGVRYLDSEFHVDDNGTLVPVRELEEIPEYFHVWERYPGIVCLYCGEVVQYDEQYLKWNHAQVHNDTRCNQASPMSRQTYKPIFMLLEDLQRDMQNEV